MYTTDNNNISHTTHTYWHKYCILMDAVHLNINSTRLLRINEIQINGAKVRKLTKYYNYEFQQFHH